MTPEARKKYALITGCTPGGIGHFLALEFVERGYHVLATVRDPTKYTSPHPHITYLPLEVTSDSSIAELHTRVASLTKGTLDILYNNAGRNYTVPALDLDLDEVALTFDTNVFSIMKLCKIFGPELIAAKGTIVMTGSLAAVMPYVFSSTYNATKAALHAYADTLRVEMAPLGVRVITVVTGGVLSNIARTHRTLAPDSYYQPVADEYEYRLRFSQSLGMDTKQYARSCVRQVLGGEGWLEKKRWIWEGKMSWIVWFAWTFLPKAGLDWYFTRKFKLWKLRGTADGKKRN